MFNYIIHLALSIAVLLLLFEQAQLKKRIRRLEDRDNLKKELCSILEEAVRQEGDLSYDF